MRRPGLRRARVWFGLAGSVALACGGRTPLEGAVGPTTDGGATGGSGGASFTCQPPRVDCAGQCVDTGSDPQHCGDCNTACSSGRCVGGACVCACSSGESCCGAQCTNLNTDPANCGGCGHACPSGSTCVAARCVQAACCSDSQNTSEPPSVSCTQGARWVAWKYVPSCSIHLTSIDLHTSGGRVALLNDAGGRPGAVLRVARLLGVSPTGWTRGTFSAPVMLQAGATYWIGERSADCSTAASGTLYPYYGSDSLAGPWDGPFVHWAWTSRLIGVCP